jgi:hypothetical protein
MSLSRILSQNPITTGCLNGINNLVSKPASFTLHYRREAIMGTRLLDRYQERIQYYSKASQNNKRAYKTARYLTVVLGALVTLLASLSSAFFVRGTWLETGLDVLTPLLAAGLVIVGGFSQNFQWGAAWSDMRIAAERLETERDRISATPPDQIDTARELALLNAMVLDETRGFFRLVGQIDNLRPIGNRPS